ncbi:MAG: hypothetical protein MUE69_06850 [Myxococcota bacterium]|nr:hypothetical protein [Myxococcota bacterium]
MRRAAAPSFVLATLASLGTLAAIAIPGCSGAKPTCEDRDVDGYGFGCEAGPDCDDTNPLRNVDCDRVPAPDCAATPFATGCPCLPGALACYAAPPETEGVGVCVGGSALCIGGHWGVCRGAQLPSPEGCNERDDDCDGRVDEGVTSPCGGCTPGCAGEAWGEPFEATDDLAVTSSGELTLRREEVLSGDVWIANSAEGTLSRIDAETAVEIGRYVTGGLEPSRVAVDWRGDAWVANREFDGVGSMRRVATDPSRCVDTDGDGLETSTDARVVDGDECAGPVITIGAEREIPRALAIDGNVGPDGGGPGDLWVGLHDGEAVLHVDGETGAIRARHELPGFSPYAANFDPWGTLWMISRDGYLASVRPSGPDVITEIREVPLPCYLLYGLDVDRDGRVLVTGFACDVVSTFDPASARWSTVSTPPSVRGAVIDDASGRAFVAHSDGRLSRLQVAPLRLESTWNLEELGLLPRDSIGVGLDAFGRVWVASGNGAPGVGVATRFDPESESVTAQVPVGRAPHTQGDLTGAKRAERFLPRGSTTRVFEGCPTIGDGPSPETEWLRLHAILDPGANGRVIVEGRHAATRAALASATFVELARFPGATSPIALDLPRGGVVELRLTLEVEGAIGAPRVRRLGIEQSCPGPE